MKLALVFGAVALAVTLPATAQPRPDPVCLQAAQTPQRSPLPYLTECVPIYCATEVDPEIKQGLHEADNKLGDLDVGLSLARISHMRLKQACRALNGDLTVVGPKMDAFSNAAYDVSVNKGKLSDIYDALREPNENSAFVKMRSSRMRTLLPAACMTSIDKQVTAGLSAAQVLIDEIQIICEPSKTPGPVGPEKR